MEQKLASLKRLLDIMDILRKECPWDREQTMLSLRNNTIEECFELTDAILDNDILNIKKELGDLLLHIIFYSRISEDEGLFNIGDVADSISDKLIYRHPHVFSDTQINDIHQVSRNWEKLKQTEQDGNKSILSGVPRSLPALTKACRIQEKASNVGFDWKDKSDVWDKVREEIVEVEQSVKAGSKQDIEAEFGDLLFTIINAARLHGINPDVALDRTNKKFIERFTFIEVQASIQGTSLDDMTLEQMDNEWLLAKQI